MTAKTQPWFRLYSEVLSDRKIMRVVASSGQPKALIVGVWVTLLSLANDSPKRGYLLIADDMPLTSDEIIAEAGMHPELGSAILKAFLTANMLRLEGDCFMIAHWDERQFVSDTSAERVKKFRQRQKGQQSPPPALPDDDPPPNGTGPVAIGYTKRYRNVSETPPESDTESEPENQKQKEGIPPPRQPDFAKVCESYQQEIGGLSQSVSDSLDDDIKTFSSDWVILAMKRAAKANRRSLNYVEGILSNWQAIGGPQNDGPRPARGESKRARAAPLVIPPLPDPIPPPPPA